MRNQSPPHNVEIEKSILSILTANPHLTPRVRSLLSVKDFFRDSHGKILDAIYQLHDSRAPSDILAVTDFMEARGDFAEDRSMTALVEEIAGAWANPASLEYYAGILVELRKGRDLLQVARQIEKSVYARDKQVDTLIDEARSVLLKTKDSATYGQWIDVGTEMPALVESVLTFRETGDPDVISTGWNHLDEALSGGLRRGQYVLIAGRPSMGKSAISTHLLQRFARDGTGCALFPFEMSARDVALRVLSGVSRVPSERIRMPTRLSDDDVDKMRVSAAQMANYKLVLNDSTLWTVDSIASEVARLKEQREISVVAIDYIQQMGGASDQGKERTENRSQEIEKISRGLRNMAREQNVMLMVVSQLNRYVEQRQDHTPRMSDLKDSGALEQDADVALLVYRPGYYDATISPERTTLILAKQRSGVTGEFQLRFDRQTLTFREINEYGEEQEENEPESLYGPTPFG